MGDGVAVAHKGNKRKPNKEKVLRGANPPKQGIASSFGNWEVFANVTKKLGVSINISEETKLLENIEVASLYRREKEDRGVVDSSSKVLGRSLISHSGAVKHEVTHISEEIEKCNDASLKTDFLCNVEEVNMTFNGNSKSHAKFRGVGEGMLNFNNGPPSSAHVMASNLRSEEYNEGGSPTNIDFTPIGPITIRSLSGHCQLGKEMEVQLGLLDQNRGATSKAYASHLAVAKDEVQ
ncbi:hypothetical protein VNO78_21427 [Psophocarpus tetragonolobus]|uniref:Uncharacterized protein n=1 Tax=Psophocarpus tetragonolobus TaxID=3891 RepID=A0AAN9XHP5_PSOTE